MKLITAVCLLLSTTTFGQMLCLEEFITSDITSNTLHDSLTENQAIPWEEGSVKFNYFDLKDNLKMRKEYSKGGKVTCLAEVSFHTQVDVVLNEDQNGQMVEYQDTLYIDVLDGAFTQYYHYPNGEVLISAIGRFENGKPIGKWEFIYPENPSTIHFIEFDIAGNPTGLFNQLYPNSSKLEWSGQFREKKIQEAFEDPLTGEIEMISVKKYCRTGTWTQFDEQGGVLKVRLFD